MNETPEGLNISLVQSVSKRQLSWCPIQLHRMKKTVLITGGSSGIGLALVHRFAKAGYRLVLSALPGSEFDEVVDLIPRSYPGIELLTYPLDLSKPDAPAQLWTFIQDQYWSIDVLVNNAGFGTWGKVHRIDPVTDVRMIDLNITAVYSLTRLALDHMQERKTGHIIFIASIAAFQPNPYMAAYGATKAFVRNFGLALYHELKEQKSPIRITTICPPAIPTAFQKVAGMQQSALFSGWLSSDVETVANAIWKGYQRKSRQVIPTWYLPIVATISRLFPESWSIWIGKLTLRKNLPK